MKIPKRRECPCMSQDMTTCTSSKFNGHKSKGFNPLDVDPTRFLLLAVHEASA